MNVHLRDGVQCPLSRVKRTLQITARMSACEPKRTQHWRALPPSVCAYLLHAHKLCAGTWSRKAAISSKPGRVMHLHMQGWRRTRAAERPPCVFSTPASHVASGWRSSSGRRRRSPLRCATRCRCSISTALKKARRTSAALFRSRYQRTREIVCRNWANELVGDAPIAADQESLRHTIDTPVNRCTAGLVAADGRERVSIAIEESPRIVRRVLVVDTDKLDALVLCQLLQQWRFVMAGHAPRCPHVYQRHRTLKGRRAKPRHHLAIALEPGERRQIDERRRAPDQRRRNSRRVAGTKTIKKQRRQREKNDQGKQQQQVALLFAGALTRHCAHGLALAVRPTGDSAFLEVTKDALLCRIVERDPGGQCGHHKYRDRIGGEDEIGVRAEIHVASTNSWACSNRILRTRRRRISLRMLAT